MAALADKKDAELARKQLSLLLNIVYSKFQAHKFLLDGGGINIYRLGHFRYHSVGSRYDRALSFVESGFCFLLQVCLSLYVGAEMIDVFILAADDVTWSLQNLPLAIITLFYSGLVFLRDLRDTRQAKATVYNKPSLFLAMDLFINVGLHFFLLLTGFIVIFVQDTFIDAVLNAAALLFIIELDDNLHQILGYSVSDVVENYLVKLSMSDLDGLIEHMDSKDSTFDMTSLNRKAKARLNLEFGDYYLTNQQEQGTIDGTIFQPFKFKSAKMGAKGQDNLGGYMISPNSVVSESCLIKKIEWWYTKYPTTTSPRIEGANSAQDFMDAFKYYALWNISPGATKLLRSRSHEEKKIQRNKEKKKVLAHEVVEHKTRSNIKKLDTKHEEEKIKPALAPTRQSESPRLLNRNMIINLDATNPRYAQSERSGLTAATERLESDGSSNSPTVRVNMAGDIK
ncbi:unnamed protein product [Cylindrotheca closterium]|uniref:Uncharacterized protein n=1 Tax=Cylindrotheca closterium TaxID=2856 RepID=A0AAD2FJF4_9STRA|nr:unnamed protein product [Cylindrotheca closterium]